MCWSRLTSLSSLLIFIIMDFTADDDTPILLGRPFLATGRTLIDVEKGELTMRVNAQEVTFNVLKAMKYPTEDVEDVSLLQCWDSLVQKQFNKSRDPLVEELAPCEDKELVSNNATGEDSTQPIIYFGLTNMRFWRCHQM